MQYNTGKHCVFYHRYHLVWSTKYRYKILTGALRLRVRDICRQVCAENGVDILRGVLERSCASVRVGAAEARHLGSDAQDEGPFVIQGAAGVSRDPQALLGATVLGARVFFDH